MKKFVLVLALIIANIGLNAQSIGSYIIVEHDDYSLQYTVSNMSPAECTVASLPLTTNNAIELISIPETIEIEGAVFTVTAIANEAFAYCYSVSKFELPSTITYIGEKAFYYCNLATEIAIPESVTYIGGSAFYGCAIKDVVIPEGVTSLLNGLFHRCLDLQNIEIPNTVTSIGRMVFGDCFGLTNITLPESISTIDDYAFSGCKNLAVVKCYATTPPTCGNIFTNVPEDMIIRVPAVSLDLYKTTTPWNKYDLRAIETEDIEENTNSLGIYPNPANDNLVIEAEENILEINIYDVTGSLINNVGCRMNNVEFVNVSELNSGVYLVKVKTERNEVIKRIIKL